MTTEQIIDWGIGIIVILLFFVGVAICGIAGCILSSMITRREDD